MVPFYDWCDSTDMPLGNHHVRVMTGRPGDIATGIQMTARAIPAHYTTEERIAAALAKLGARLENGKYPTLSLFFIQTAIY